MPAVYRRDPEAIAAYMDSSGPVFIKLGQWLSTRRDLFSEELCDAMGILHEKVSAQASTHDVQLARELAPGVEIHELLGAGCIARVYRGELDGKAVAVKVRRENVETFLNLDMEILQAAARVVLKLWPQYQWLMLEKALDEFSFYMKSQTDFRNEASNLRRFRQNLTEGKMQAPEPYAVNEKVLIMELVKGESLSTFLQEKHSAKLRHQVWSILSDQTAKMVLKDNFVHADLHPGNVIVTLTEKKSFFRGATTLVPTLTLIDAGMVFQLPSATAECLKCALNGALKHDPDAVGEAFVNIHHREGLCEPSMPQLSHQLGVLGLCCVFTCEEWLWSQVFPSRAAYLGARTTEYFHRMADILTQNEVRVSPPLWSLLMSFALIEGSLQELGYRTNVLRSALPYILSPSDISQRVSGALQCFLSECLNTT